MPLSLYIDGRRVPDDQIDHEVDNLARRQLDQDRERRRQESWRDRSSPASTFDNWKQYPELNPDHPDRRK